MAEAAAPAAASQVKPAPSNLNHPRGFVPHRPNARQSNAGSTNPNCGACNPPLLFTRGVPVIGGLSGTPGHVTITPFYWAASGYSFSATYKSIINGYLANVAHDSGTNGNVFSVATQYYQQDTMAGAPKEHISYGVAAGAEVDDSASYPSGCTPATGFTACVADDGLQSEVKSHLAEAGLHMDDTQLYLVFFPSGVETCAQQNGSNVCSDNTYCAYHSATASTPYLIYANEPYPNLSGCASPAMEAPNGDAEADAQVSLISHEANEAVTDWADAWFDSAGYENGDECAYVYGAAQGAPGALYNQVIGTGHYYTQDEFSNEDYALGRGDKVGATLVAGCVQQEELPTASFTGPSTIDAGTTANFDASSSSDADSTSSPLNLTWNWGDGSPNSGGAKVSHFFCSPGNYSVSLRVTDLDGWQATAKQTVTAVPHNPVITGVAPAVGTPAGGTSVAITGCALTGTTSVQFGSTSASYSVVSDQLLNATSPQHSAGTIDIAITTSTGASSASPADRFTYAFSGVYTLDGYGGMSGDDSGPVSTTSYFPGWNIARGAHAWPKTGATQQGFVLDGWGGLHPYGPAGLSETTGVSGHYWPGSDIARDFAFMPDGSGGLVLDGYGGLHPFAVNGGTAPMQVVGNSYWPGWDIAKKVVIFADGSGGYVLDGYGGLHPFGINQSVSPTLSNLELTSYWNWNIARDVVLIPGNGGHSGYILDGYGGLHPFHPTGDGSTLMGAIATSYPGFDIMRGLYFLPASSTSGYTLDGYGGIHPFGGAPAIVNHPYWPGWDIAKSICGA
jgi:hypothetical protein